MSEMRLELTRHNCHYPLKVARLPIPPSGHESRTLGTEGFLSEKRDSNPRPRPWQGRALPTELFSHINRLKRFSETISMNSKHLSEKRDSNPRPRPWQGRALPTELFSHGVAPAFSAFALQRYNHFLNYQNISAKKCSLVPFLCVFVGWTLF